MRILIVTQDDPFYINPLLRDLLLEPKNQVVGVILSKRNRLHTQKSPADWSYANTLRIIVGNLRFIWMGIRYLIHKVPFLGGNVLVKQARKQGIPVATLSSFNSPKSLAYIRSFSPDVIILQTLNIVKQEFLDIPKKGVINRHHSLLPRNRGRLSPFWALYHGDEETGTTIYIPSEGIDEGEILIQETVEIKNDDDFNSLTKKLYVASRGAIQEALNLLRRGERINFETINHPTYNTIPTKKEAIEFRAKLNRKRKNF